jgi:carboxylesterase
MPQYPNLDPSAFELPGGPVGCLLIHGFTGSAVEMRPMGDYLAARGLTVSAPLLPGHGTTPEDLARTTWQNWYAHVEQAFDALRRRRENVFVIGFSLGSLLALHLAAQHEMAGVVALSPAILARDWRIPLVPLLRHVIRAMPKDPDPQHSDLTDKEALKGFWSYDVYPVAAAYQLYLLQRVVRSELGPIRTPVLIIYAERDMSIHPQSGPTLHKEIGSPDKEEVVLHNSGHGIVLDVERGAVFQKVSDWMAAH